MSASHELDVVVVGEINVDIIVSGLGGPPVFGAEHLVDEVILTAGSSGVLTAVGLMALGLRVGMCGLVGDDAFGRYMLDYLDQHSIERSGVVIDPGVRTGCGVILTSAHDRAILTHTGAMSLLRLQQVRLDIIAKARHLHLSSYFLQRELQQGVQALLAHAHSLGMTTSVDTGFDPAENWQVAGLFTDLDIFLPNQLEAEKITGESDIALALDQLALQIPTVAIKCGPAGAYAAQGPLRVHMPGFSVKAIDTTGAGDAFNAGFLAAWLSRRDVSECLHSGNACGALTAAHLGGAGGFNSSDVVALLAEPCGSVS